MKILEFIDGFNFESFGGAGRVFVETAKIFSLQGHSIDVICRNDHSGNYNNPFGIRFRHYNCGNLNIFGKYFHRRSSIRKLFDEYLQDNIPDMIIVHSSSAILGVTEKLAKLAAPKIYMFHSPWCEEHRVNGDEIFPIDMILYTLRKKSELKALEICDGIVMLSRYMQGLMLETHPEVKSKNMTIIPGGADINKFYPASGKEDKTCARRKYGIPEDSFVIMTSRRLIPRTGVDILVRAFAKAKAKVGKNMKLLIVGTGVMLDELKTLSSSLEMDREIIFTGFAGEDELPSCYRASDLFIMPTRELEGFGLSTVEAMACGIPAIGTDVGATPEILGEISGDLIIKEYSVDALSEKLVKFSNRESLAGLGEKSLELVGKKFNWNMHVKKMNEFMSRLALN